MSIALSMKGNGLTLNEASGRRDVLHVKPAVVYPAAGGAPLATAAAVTSESLLLNKNDGFA